MPNVSVTGGTLIVDGRILQVPTDHLKLSLREADEQIRHEIAKLQQQYAGSSPSIWTLYLGERKEVLSEYGQQFATQGHYTERQTLQPRFGGYWDLVEQCGFAPEAREGSGQYGAPSGVYLLVKLP